MKQSPARVLAVYSGLPKSIYILFASRVIDNMGSVVMPMITLILTQKIGFSKAQTGILATVFMLTQAPFLLLGGKLVDRLGSKRVIVLFNTLGALAYVPCALMRPGILMAAFIAAAADLFSVAAPAYNSIAVELCPGPQLKKAYSFLYLGYNLGLAVGPALGGMLFDRHLQLLFCIDAGTCFLSTALVHFVVPERGAENGGAVLGGDAASKEEFLPLKDSHVLRFLLHTPGLLLFSAGLLVYNFCYSQWGFMLPLQAASLFHAAGAQNYSLLVSVNAAAVILFTPFLTAVTHRFRPIASVCVGGVFYTVAFLMYGAGAALSAFFAATVFLTMGQILININTSLYFAQQTPPSAIGRVNSLLAILNGVGVAVGPVIMGHVLLALSYRQAWDGVAALVFCGSAAMLLLGRRTSAENGEKPAG